VQGVGEMTSVEEDSVSVTVKPTVVTALTDTLCFFVKASNGYELLSSLYKVSPRVI
jgi:hypothetical protein